MRLDLPPSWPPCYPAHRAITAQEARRIDDLATSRHGLPSLVLMEHAARGIARVAVEIVHRRKGAAGRVLCLCGPGNNGGDGYGAARFLRSWGHPVQVLRCAPTEPTAGDARKQFEILRETETVPNAWEQPDRVREAIGSGPTLILDALFGVGLTRELSGPYLDWVRAMNSAMSLRLAVDVPSGMETDTGRGLPECVQAHVTATMAAPKVGFAANPAACGRIVEIDIGLPAALHAPFLAQG